jgi:hypothetical protein
MQITVPTSSLSVTTPAGDYAYVESAVKLLGIYMA